MQVLASQLLFLASQLLFMANRNAGLAISPLFWLVNCIKIRGHVALLSDPTVNCLYCGVGLILAEGPIVDDELFSVVFDMK